MPFAADIAIVTGAIGFAIMGLTAFVAPHRVTQQFDIHELTASGRNEIRAVYGGFGVVMSFVLVLALIAPELRAGICFTTAAALAGMAAGRIVSALMDRTLGRAPRFYLLIEVVAAAFLAYAA